MKNVREGYKMTELGEIPNEWDVITVNELVTFIKSGLSRNLKDEDVGIPCIRSSNIVNGRINYDDLKYWFLIDDKGANIEDYLLNDGDILVNFINSMAQIGKTCIYKSNGRKSIYTTNIFRVDFNKDKILNEYFYYFSQTDKYKKEIELITKPAVNQASFTTVDFKKIKLIVPKIKEQEKITSILSTVDEQIDNVDGLIQKNKELKKGLMQQLLTKGIGHTKFKKTEIGEIPEEWEVKKFFEFVEKIIDFRGRTPKKLGMEWGNGDIQALSANNVKMGKIDFSLECYLASIELYEKWMNGNELSKDDILMTMEAPLGNIALVPDERKYILSQRVVALKTKDNIVNKFMKYLLMSDIVQNQLDMLSTGTTAKGINQKNLAKVMVLIPSIEEQEKIAAILAEIDKKIEEYENKKQKLDELKKGLMQKLLMGKIRVV